MKTVELLKRVRTRSDKVWEEIAGRRFCLIARDVM